MESRGAAGGAVGRGGVVGAELAMRSTRGWSISCMMRGGGGSGCDPAAMVRRSVRMTLSLGAAEEAGGHKPPEMPGCR